MYITYLESRITKRRYAAPNYKRPAWLMGWMSVADLLLFSRNTTGWVIDGDRHVIVTPKFSKILNDQVESEGENE